MVRLEIAVAVLAYNLVRSVMCRAGKERGVLPRQLSFTETCVYLLEHQVYLVCEMYDEEGWRLLFKQLGSLLIPYRPDRYEPRVVKRRAKPHKLMVRPRWEYRRDFYEQQL